MCSSLHEKERKQTKCESNALLPAAITYAIVKEINDKSNNEKKKKRAKNLAAATGIEQPAIDLLACRAIALPADILRGRAGGPLL